MKFVDGVELSVKVNHGRMHILGYGIDIDNKYLMINYRGLRKIRLIHFWQFMKKLKENII